MRVLCFVFIFQVGIYAYGQCEIRDIPYGTRDRSLSVFEITNRSSEDYYFWIARRPVSNYTEKDLIHYYFFSRNSTNPAAMSLFDLIYDWDFPSLQTEVGRSFLKLIKPNHSFYVVGRKLLGDLNAFKDSFVTIPVRKVEKMIGMIPWYLKYPPCVIYILHDGLSECGIHKDSYSIRPFLGSKDMNSSWGIRFR